MNPVAMPAHYGYELMGEPFTLEKYFKGLNKITMADDKDMVNSPAHYTQGAFCKRFQNLQIRLIQFSCHIQFLLLFKGFIGSSQ
jgi:hypothetical protein